MQNGIIRNPLWGCFDKVRGHLEKQYLEPRYDASSGLSIDELMDNAKQYLAEHKEEPRIVQKANIFSLVLSQGQIEVDEKDWFADRLNHGDLLIKIRREWHLEVEEKHLTKEKQINVQASEKGSFIAELDVGHTSPDWSCILRYGPLGLRERARQARKLAESEQKLTEEKRAFYEAVDIVYSAVIKFIRRLSVQAEKMGREHPQEQERMEKVAHSLYAISERPPQTLHEALQLAYIYHELQEMEGENVRSMGGFDSLYYPYYANDLKMGRLTRDQAKELIQFFFFKFFAKTQGLLMGKNFYFGGQNPDGTDRINDLSYAAYEAYEELATVDPKLSVRVHSKTPDAFLRKVANCIRSGLNSMVLANDEVTIPTMLKHGKTPEDAYNYLLIGCYEPAVAGKEISCSMAITLNMAKSVELALYNGMDPLSGEQIGIQTGEAKAFRCFEDFYAAYKKQLAYQTKTAINITKTFEKYWPVVNPSPLLSGTMTECIQQGRDVSAGGAKYNNSGCMCCSFASTVDSLFAIKTLVFEQKLCSLEELQKLLKEDWKSNEQLRLIAQTRLEKWGNNYEQVDKLGRTLADFMASIVNGEPNNRGGQFAAALFSIDFCHKYGLLTGALPDGRRAYQPLSKNLGAVTAMDKEGVTALINSVTKLDFTQFPDGSVLDIMLHPTAVQGEDGLNALVSLIRTYFGQGGFAIQFNIFDVNTLLDAQKHPERYANLQVRVCGWNVYFVNLSTAEQEEFIKSAAQIS